MSNDRPLLRSIQWLRGLAAVAVLVMHTADTNDRRGIHVPGFNNGDFGMWGVDLFFCISGFIMILVTQSYGPELKNVWKFWSRRLVRIVPPYWILTIAVTLAMIKMPGFSNQKATIPNFVESLLFLTGEKIPLLRVGWTLTYEMFFYFIFGIAILCVPRLRGLVTSLFLLVAIGYHYALNPTNQYLRAYSEPIIGDFVLGMIVGSLWVNQIALPRVGALVAILAGIVGIVLGEPHAKTIPSVLIYGIPSSFIFYGALSLEKSLPKIFEVKLFEYLGDASYSIYLSHTLFLAVFGTILSKFHSVPGALISLVDILLALASGCAVFKFIESPVVKYFTKVVIGSKARPPEPITLST